MRGQSAPRGDGRRRDGPRECNPVRPTVTFYHDTGETDHARPVITVGIEARSDPASNHPLLSCAVVDRPQRDPVTEAQLADANRVFAIMEAACPAVFSPTPLASEHVKGLWQRQYANTEATP